jgi:DNA-binding XRE family transcriptional regulator
VREIRLYRTLSGKIPVKEFLDSLPSKHAQKVAWVLELVETLDQVPVQYFKKYKKHRNRKSTWLNNEKPITYPVKEEHSMSDLQAYISERKKSDPEFAEGYEEGLRSFKIGVLLKQAREKAGLTQDEVARQLNTKKTAVSRIENHAEDIRLSTLEKYARAFGKKLRIELVD